MILCRHNVTFPLDPHRRIRMSGVVGNTNDKGDLDLSKPSRRHLPKLVAVLVVRTLVPRTNSVGLLVGLLVVLICFIRWKFETNPRLFFLQNFPKLKFFTTLTLASRNTTIKGICDILYLPVDEERICQAIPTTNSCLYTTKNL